MENQIERPLDKDFLGKLNGRLRTYRMLLMNLWYTTLTYPTLSFKGIEVGKGCKFYGKSHFRRSPHTRIKIGNNVSFRSAYTSNLIGMNRPCLISTWFDKAVIEIGDNVGMSGTVIGGKEYIKIGNNVMCGGNSFITDHDWHPLEPSIRHNCSLAPSAPTIIEDNVWLGMNSVVMKGVTIGENSVIGANSVVVKSIPPNVIAAGNPARVIKPLPMLKEDRAETIRETVNL